MSMNDTQKKISFLLTKGIVNNIDDATIKADYVAIHHNKSLQDIAKQLIEELYDADMIKQNRVNYKSVANDIKDDGIYYEIDNDVYEYLG